ncbi:MAG: cation transporter [Candidatus Aminicenantes bacterium]|nr:MAG: cation transporter [Candidatus Aminicenantes bacterium]
MPALDKTNKAIASQFIKNFDDVFNNHVRAKYGIFAGWISITAIVVLFIIKMGLGIRAGSISVVANAFHLLSHLANSVILLVSFRMATRPATAKTPYGHGRMEHVAPLIMSIFLFVSGIQIAEQSLHQVLQPHEVHYWNALPWILLATIIIKQWLAQFIKYLGKRVESHAILANAFHQTIEAVMSLTVIAGLVAGHYFHKPEVDGYIGILVSLWLLYMGFSHGREAIVPLLGKAPSQEFIQKIREAAKSVDGVEDVHEIIVHDYGTMYTISLHLEIPEKFGPIEIHDITERCEAKLRVTFRGETIAHSDPLLELTPEIQAIEDRFKKVLEEFPEITGYHDFRVVAESKKMKIIVADIDTAEKLPESEFDRLAKKLNVKCIEKIPDIAYCSFYITPKYAY